MWGRPMIRYLCRAVCYGCRAPVTVWQDGDRTTLRDQSIVNAPVHLCADPEKRERIELGSAELLAFECWRCGEKDVAPTTWGRVVDFPSSTLSVLDWSEAFVGPLHEHVCRAAPNTPENTKQRAPEAFRVWTDGGR